MSPRLAISIAISVLTMTAFVLSSTEPAPRAFEGREERSVIEAQLPSPAQDLRALASPLLR